MFPDPLLGVVEISNALVTPESLSRCQSPGPALVEEVGTVDLNTPHAHRASHDVVRRHPCGVERGRITRLLFVPIYPLRYVAELPARRQYRLVACLQNLFYLDLPLSMVLFSLPNVDHRILVDFHSVVEHLLPDYLVLFEPFDNGDQFVLVQLF